jgi:restriction system protein
MKRHRSFEFFVGEYLRQLGYTDVDVTQGVADWGVDAFAMKDGKKYVVQAKMYGDCKTKVNRRQMMELYGVMHYFDCQCAIMIYNGRIMDDAVQVANKLGIQLKYLDQHLMDEPVSDADQTQDGLSFNSVWTDIRSLAGRTIANSRGTTYQIVSVTDGDVTYINQAGHQLREKSDLFRQIVGYICRYGNIQQCQLRGEFGTYSSAFIATVFANIPSCEVTPNPTTIKLRQ